MPIAKNISQTASISFKVGSQLLTLLTNPYFWIAVIIPFFPLNLLNYFILFVVNFVIVIANIVLYILQLFLWMILAIGVGLINILVGLFNNISFTVPLPAPIPDVTISLPNIPTFPTPPFPTFGTIAYYGISQVDFFPAKTFLMWIFELIGIGLPI
jgi:hypothetical protein